MSNMAFSQIIYEATAGANPVMTVAEAAKIMSVSESTIYDYRHDRTEPSYSKIKALAKELDKRGYFALAMQFMPDNSSGNANGCLDDESAQMVQLIGRLYNATDKTDFMKHVTEMRGVVDDFEAEGREL